jgi:hypothetical protein
MKVICNIKEMRKSVLAVFAENESASMTSLMRFRCVKFNVGGEISLSATNRIFTQSVMP